MPNMVLRAFAYESITVAATAIGLTATTLEGASTGPPALRAVVTVENAEIRIRYDGTDPTATEGHTASPGDSITIEGAEDLRAFRAIRTGAVSGLLKVSYERE